MPRPPPLLRTPLIRVGFEREPAADEQEEKPDVLEGVRRAPHSRMKCAPWGTPQWNTLGQAGRGGRPHSRMKCAPWGTPLRNIMVFAGNPGVHNSVNKGTTNGLDN
jgi:hypothetical protein